MTKGSHNKARHLPGLALRAAAGPGLAAALSAPKERSAAMTALIEIVGLDVPFRMARRTDRHVGLGESSQARPATDQSNGASRFARLRNAAHLNADPIVTAAALPPRRRPPPAASLPLDVARPRLAPALEIDLREVNVQRLVELVVGEHQDILHLRLVLEARAPRGPSARCR